MDAQLSLTFQTYFIESNVVQVESRKGSLWLILVEDMTEGK